MVLIALVLALAAGIPTAQAQDPVDDPSSAQLDAPIPPREGTAGGSASASASAGGLDDNVGSLPLTGMDLLIVAGVAFVLTGTGLALRRVSAPPDPRF